MEEGKNKTKQQHGVVSNFQQFFSNYREGTDYVIEHVQRHTDVALIAIHGVIERNTETITRSVANNDKIPTSYYIFHGKRYYDEMHLTSTRYDEDRLLQLISSTNIVISIHGYSQLHGEVLIGGLDTKSKKIIHKELNQRGISAVIDTHRFPGTDPENICNRGKCKKGVQLELPRSLRDSPDDLIEALIEILQKF